MSLDVSAVSQFAPWLRFRTINDLVTALNLRLLERLTVQNVVIPVAGDSAAADTYSWAAFKAPSLMQVVAASFVPHGTATASDTTYATLALKVGSTTLASVTTKTVGGGGSGSLVLNTPIAMTVASRNIAKDDVLLLTQAKASTGVQMPAGNWHLLLAERSR